MQGGVVGKGKFKLDNASNVLVDLSEWATNVPALKQRDMLNSDTLDGSASHSTTPGLRDGQEFTVEFLYHQTPLDHLKAVDALDNTTLTYESSPEGTASGKPKLSGECYLKTFNVNAPVGNITTMTATFIQTGAQAWGAN